MNILIFFAVDCEIIKGSNKQRRLQPMQTTGTYKGYDIVITFPSLASKAHSDIRFTSRKGDVYRSQYAGTLTIEEAIDAWINERRWFTKN